MCKRLASARCRDINSAVSFVDSRVCWAVSCDPVNLAGSNHQIPLTNVVAVIPARFASTRLPGKALIEIAGKPMVCWVAERARAARNISRVIVATDSDDVFNAAKEHGIEAVMTDPAHASGTDRIAEVVENLPDAEIIVNVQGDEPLISPETIERAVDTMSRETVAGIVTTWEPIESIDDLLNFDVVKVVVSDEGYAIYFSRSPMPFPRDASLKHGGPNEAVVNEPGLLSHFRKHTGLYVYRREVLLEFTRWPQTTLERFERLEQLRALEHGIKIRVIQASTSSIGVDTADDLEKVRELVNEGRFQLSRGVA